MTTLWVGVIVSVMFVQGVLAFQGRDKSDQWNRVGWMVMGLLMLEAVTMPNVWMGLLLAVVVMGCWPMIPRSDILLNQPVLVGLLAGAYALTVPHVTAAMVPGLLIGLVGLGVVVAAWGVYAKTRPMDVWCRQIWKWWYVYDESRVCPRAGQGNANHAQSLAALGVAACLGLMVLQSRWWGVLLPVLLVPMGVCRDARAGWFSQGVLHTGVAAMAAGMLWLRPSWGTSWPWVFPAGVGLLALACLHPRVGGHLRGFDSGRLRLWREVLTELWWPQGMVVRWCGFGTSSWRRLTAPFTRPRFQQVAFTAAHNEYVEMLFQYGIVGLLVLLGVLGSYLYRAWTGGETGAALFLVEMTLCSIAATNFPWTFFHACAEERPYSYTVTGKHKEKGDALFVGTRKEQAFQSYDEMVRQGVEHPAITVWYHQHPPALLTETHRTLDIDHDPPRHVGNPGLVMVSFLIAVFGMTV